MTERRDIPPDLVSLVSGAGRRVQRRRRTPEEARAEILEAAHRFLEDRPFRELTVETLMEYSVLSRSSFYVYFEDRHEVLRALIADIAGEVVEFSRTWVGGDGGKNGVIASLKSVKKLYRKHGRVLRALADGAAVDPELEQIHAELARILFESTQSGIEREQARGASVVKDAKQVARALVLMTERIANVSWGSAGVGANNGDEVLAALEHIWCWAIYGEGPEAVSSGASDEPSQ